MKNGCLVFTLSRSDTRSRSRPGGLFTDIPNVNEYYTSHAPGVSLAGNRVARRDWCNRLSEAFVSICVDLCPGPGKDPLKQGSRSELNNQQGVEERPHVPVFLKADPEANAASGVDGHPGEDPGFVLEFFRYQVL